MIQYHRKLWRSRNENTETHPPVSYEDLTKEKIQTSESLDEVRKWKFGLPFPVTALQKEIVNLIVLREQTLIGNRYNGK